LETGYENFMGTAACATKTAQADERRQPIQFELEAADGRGRL
jgi:hypothetical protein